jgi:YHS domain-containing protein
MKTHRLTSTAALALVCSLTLPLAFAQAASVSAPPAAENKAANKGPAKPYPLKVCLVTDNDLDSMGDEISIVYEGQTIKFCCAPCEKKFRANPARYLAKLAPKVPDKK